MTTADILRTGHQELARQGIRYLDAAETALEAVSGAEVCFSLPRLMRGMERLGAFEASAFCTKRD
jgi:hypothetical protein